MTAWIILVRFSLESPSGANEFLVRAEDITLQIRKECPKLVWVSCYVTLGEFDMVLVVQSEDASQVQKAAMIFRAQGHEKTQVMHAVPWNEFAKKL